MDLPVVNKEKAIARIWKIASFFTFLSLFLYINSSIVEMYYILVTLNIITFLLLFKHYKKHNIKAQLSDESIIVYHKKKVITIPISDIHDIRTELNNYVGKAFEWSTVYILFFKKVYSFGDKIHLKYEFNSKIINEGSVQIQEIKELMQKGKINKQ